MDEMTKRVVAFVKERDWEQFHMPKDTAISLALEAAEVMEHFQWKSEKEIQAHLRDNKQEVADELADVMYWVLLMAHYFDIDLEESFEMKMQQNEKKYPVEKARGRHSKYTAYE